jgi:hypothetical protein
MRLELGYNARTCLGTCPRMGMSGEMRKTKVP